MKPSKSIF